MMATPKKNYSVNIKICRLCADDRDYSRSTQIFNNTKILAGDISDILGISVDKNDGLPSTVCRKCATKLNKFKEFKALAHETQVNLKSRTKRCQHFSPSIEPDIKKVNTRITTQHDSKRSQGRCLLGKFEKSAQETDTRQQEAAVNNDGKEELMCETLLDVISNAGLQNPEVRALYYFLLLCSPWSAGNL